MITPRSVLHVNTERGWRGGEAQTLFLARGLQERGYACRLAVPVGSALERRSREAGMEVLPLASRGELDPAGAHRLARLLSDISPHLVHYHTSHSITLGTLASLLTSRRPSVASRRVSFPFSRNPLARIKYTCRVDRIIAVSEGIRETLMSAGVPGERIVVIPSAVDLDRFRALTDRGAFRESLGAGPDQILVGAIGHLAAHKGHAVLVEAARRSVAVAPQLRFVVVGRGELEGELRRRIDAAGLASVFRLVGFREEVGELLQALDLLAFPSVSGEGSPAVLKEAMACGVPIVASDSSGVREVVRPEIEGLLVPPGDASALAGAILRLSTDADLRGELARRGRKRSLEYSIGAMVTRTESVYDDLLASRRP